MCLISTMRSVIQNTIKKATKKVRTISYKAIKRHDEQYCSPGNWQFTAYKQENTLFTTSKLGKV